RLSNRSPFGQRSGLCSDGDVDPDGKGFKSAERPRARVAFVSAGGVSAGAKGGQIVGAHSAAACMTDEPTGSPAARSADGDEERGSWPVAGYPLAAESGLATLRFASRDAVVDNGTPTSSIPDPGLAALVMLLRFQGLGVELEQIRHQFGATPIGIPEMLRCA